MPKLSSGADEVTLIAWIRQVGDRVAEGEPIAEVETDKATAELVSPGTGYLSSLLVTPGSHVSVGTPVATLSETAAAETPSPVNHAQSQPMPNPRLRMSPAARRLARHLGISPEGVTGSGPRGRIVLRDIEEAARTARKDTASPQTPRLADIPAAEAAAAQPAMGQRVPLDRIRLTIARRMTLSAQTIPQFSISREVEMAEVIAFQTLINRHLHEDERLSVIDFLIQAVSRTLKQYPYLNASFEGPLEGPEPAVRLHEAVNIGLATDTGAGLLVPVLSNAANLSLIAAAKARRTLMRRAAERSLLPGDLTGGTFTISNLGPAGADSFVAMVNPPAAAILAVGRLVDRPVARGGEMMIRPMMNLNLTVDHRLVDGMMASSYLMDVTRYLELPNSWSLV